MPAIFLDRDGVINVNHGYVYTRENFNFIDGIFDFARHAHSQNYKIVVITNQAGIGRGYYTEEEFYQLSDWMCEQFLVAGAPISRVYFSPYHPTAGIGKYLKDDFSRKPYPGMIFQAQMDLDIDIKSSLLIGDKISDILAGNAAGIGKNLLFAPHHPVNYPNNLRYELITSLRQALHYLTNPKFKEK